MLYSYFIPISLYVSIEIVKAKSSAKGHNFIEERITNGNWVNEARSDLIQKFLILLAICHTAIPEVDEETGRISYEAESPDEAAFAIAARELGFQFFERTQTSISLHELDTLTGKTIESVMFVRLSRDGNEFVEQTKEHVNEYAPVADGPLIPEARLLYEAYLKLRFFLTGERLKIANLNVPLASYHRWPKFSFSAYACVCTTASLSLPPSLTSKPIPNTSTVRISSVDAWYSSALRFARLGFFYVIP
ncbi:hypothetical protein SAY86_011899 [Trapa natans]|uniref:Uncharacterized protein n=1 Tax=Trapa natans TaxID=22666 RepID=A0AAN7LWD6_TRANT|nr:hypothetical protein SAY86_011899 [Trapa natans]